MAEVPIARGLIEGRPQQDTLRLRKVKVWPRLLHFLNRRYVFRGGFIILLVCREVLHGDPRFWIDVIIDICGSKILIAVVGIVVAGTLLNSRNEALMLAALVSVTFGDWDLLVECGSAAFQLFHLFYLMVLSVVEFVHFMSLAWTGILTWCLGGPMPQMVLLEWLAISWIALSVAHCAFAVKALVCKKKWARRSSEEELRIASHDPFRVEFDQEILRRTPQANSRGISQSLATEFIHPELSADQIEHLEATHTALLASRHAFLEEQWQTGCHVDFEDIPPERLSVEVRRDNILQDSWSALLEAAAMELLSPGLEVTYTGETAVDEGGVARDWFDTVGQILLDEAEDDQSNSLFTYGKSSKMVIPRPCHRENKESHFQELLTAGRFLALGVVHGGRPLQEPLSPLLCKYIIGAPVNMSDIRSLDIEFYNAHIVPLIQEDGLAKIEADLGEPLTFISVPTELHPQQEELIPGGAAKIVSQENLQQYLQLLCDAFLCAGIRQEIQCLLRGFWDVLPQTVLKETKVSSRDLALLISGTKALSVNAWQSHASHQEDGIVDSPINANNARESQHIISWFWEIMSDWDDLQRRTLLRFATGSGRLPPGGFPSLRPPFTVVVSQTTSPDYLPYSHTCINRLVLHEYKSKQQLSDKLLQALDSRDFGFA